jgi:hypothetical protein
MTNYVPVHVPEEHIPRVYALLASLMPEEVDHGDDIERRQSPAIDEELVRRMYDDSFGRHRRLLRYLAANADRWISSKELAEALELPSGSKSVAGMFGAFGRRAKHRYGGAKPWKFSWDSEQGENSYRMTSEVAGWIKEAAS